MIAFNHGVFASTVTGAAPVADTAFSIIGSENIVAAYKLRYNSLDFKSGNDGTDNAIAYETEAPTNLPGSAHFNASTSYIQTSRLDNVSFISGWIYLDTASPSNLWLIDNRDVGGSKPGWALYLNAAGEINLTNDIGASSQALRTSGLSWSASTWYHIAIVIDSSGGNNIYRNGVSQTLGANTITGDSLTNQTDTYAYIGSADGSLLEFDGNISQLIVGTSVPSSDNILALYNSGDGVELGEPDSLYSESLTTGLQLACEYNRNANDQYSTHDGTVTGATLTAINSGNHGYAYTFDGVNDYISHGAGLDITSAITVEAWVKSPTGSGDEYIAGEDDGTNRNWYIQRTNTGTSFVIFIGGTAYTATDTSELPDDTIAHVVGIYDGSTVKIYVNNSIGATTASITGSIDADAVNVEVGRKGDSSNYFTGEILTFRVWNTDKTSSIAALYNSGNGVTVGRPSVITDHGSLSTDARSYWNFNSDATDEVGSNDLTVTGATNATGFIGNGYTLDGTGDYLRKTSMASFGTAFTIAGWIKSTSSANVRIVNFNDGTNNEFLNSGWRSDDTIRLQPVDSTSTLFTAYTSALETDKWYFYVLTANSPSWKVYVDGVEEISQSAAFNYTLSNQFTLGADNNGNAGFAGQFDEFFFSNKGLTAGEAEVFFNLGDGLTYS